MATGDRRRYASMIMIDKNSFAKLLNNHPSVKWELRTDEAHKKECKWFHVFTYKCPSTNLDHNYGLIEDGTWCSEYSDHDRIRVDKEYYLGFWVLLEAPHETVVSLIRNSISAVGLPEIVLYTFPLDSIVECALQDTGYWREYAERWIESGYPINERIAEIIPDNKLVLTWKKEKIERIFRT